MTAPTKRKPGRPLGSTIPADQRKDVLVVAVRIEGAERRAKFRRLGRQWLEAAIDRAKETSAAPG